jgi:hypothetical protein
LTQTEVNIATVADLVKTDLQIVSRMIAESLNFPKTVVLQILKEDLGKRLTKLLKEMRPGVLPMTPKQSDRVLNGLVRHPLSRRN